MLMKKLLGRRFLALRRFIRLIMPDTRTALAKKYLTGSGIEIGALHQPLIIPYRTGVKYVDRLSVADLRAHYPELKDYPLVEVDIIDDGERLEKVAPDSQDFAIANHLLEHCQDPISVIKTFLRVLKNGGILYLAVPDKRFTFDIDRPVTTLEHLIRDYKEGPAGSRKEHFYEWTSLKLKKSGAELEAHAKMLMDNNYSIHFHVWTDKELSEFFTHLKQELKLGFEILESVFSNNENIFIIKKV